MECLEHAYYLQTYQNLAVLLLTTFLDKRFHWDSCRQPGLRLIQRDSVLLLQHRLNPVLMLLRRGLFFDPCGAALRWLAAGSCRGRTALRSTSHRHRKKR